MIAEVIIVSAEGCLSELKGYLLPHDLRVLGFPDEVDAIVYLSSGVEASTMPRIILVHVTDVEDQPLLDLLYHCVLRNLAIIPFGDNLTSPDAQFLMGRGATACLVKPIDLKELAAQVRTMAMGLPPAPIPPLVPRLVKVVE